LFFSTRNLWIIFTSLLLINVVQGVRIKCDFSLLDEDYLCTVQELEITHKNDVVEGIDGNHESGMTDNDVVLFHAANQKINYMPAKLNLLFPSLQDIKIVKSGLKELFPEDFKNFPDLSSCDFSNNEIQFLDDDTLFSSNSEMDTLSFNRNRIKQIAENILEPLRELSSVSFRNNECLDAFWEEKEIKMAKKIFLEKCPLKFDFVPLTDELVEEKEEEKDEKKDEELNNEEDNEEETSELILEVNCSDDGSCFVDEQDIQNTEYSFNFGGFDVTRVKSLTFSGSNLNYLPSNIGQNFPNLEELSVIDASLTSLTKEIFQNLPNLKTLHLSGVQNFDLDTFEDLRSLKNLNLNTEVEDIEEAFWELYSLETIYLKVPRLKTKFFEVMKDLVDVEIDFYSTDFCEEALKIETNLIRNHQKLKRLKVNGKVLIEKKNDNDEESQVSCDFVDANEVALTCSFQSMTIDDPEITIEYHENNIQVYRLTFENNKEVSFLPKNIAQAFPNLREIIAKKSSLELSPETFKCLKLKVLDVSGLELESIDPEVFNLLALEKLDFSHNSVQGLNENTLINLPALQILDLSNNKLDSINQNVFESLQNLKVVDLQNNKNLPEIDKSVLFRNNPNFQYVLLTNQVDELQIPLRESNPTEVPRKPTQKTTQQPTQMLIERMENDSSTPFLIFERPVTKISKSKVDEYFEEGESYPKEITCDLDYSDWSNEESLYTCSIRNQIIDNLNDIIEFPQYAPYVQGISFDNNNKVVRLPKKIGLVFPNLIRFSAKATSLTTLRPETFMDLDKLQGKK
jgi:Leucine-rich repeat (LRR) protein